jgi:uncharacterized peroxidase-related enzyme
MTRLNVVRPEQAEGDVRAIYDAVEAQFGTIPSIFQGLGNSPAALNALVAMAEALKSASLTEAEQHVVYLVTSQANNCDYCLSAHTLLGRKSGLSDEQVLGVRRGDAGAGRYLALARFARAVTEQKGFVTDEDLEDFRRAGYGDAHAVEVCAVIAQATFTNYFNHVHDTPLDFPPAPEL